MKKLLFAIAICGFVFTSCGNQTKPAAAEETTEATVEVENDTTKCCSAKTECATDTTATEEVVEEVVTEEEN